MIGPPPPRRSRLPLGERHGCSAILELRAWEYSEFSKLRRNEPDTHAVKKTRAQSR